MTFWFNNMFLQYSNSWNCFKNLRGCLLNFVQTPHSTVSTFCCFEEKETILKKVILPIWTKESSMTSENSFLFSFLMRKFGCVLLKFLLPFVWSPILVTNIPRIISTEDVNFTNFLATTLWSDLELLIFDFALHFFALLLYNFWPDLHTLTLFGYKTFVGDPITGGL